MAIPKDSIVLDIVEGYVYTPSGDEVLTAKQLREFAKELDESNERFIGEFLGSLGVDREFMEDLANPGDTESQVRAVPKSEKREYIVLRLI